jgi:site-specific DNA recombinase
MEGGDSMKAIGYMRVSTEEQVQTGVSLDAQEEKITAYYVAKGWELIQVIRDERFSAKDLNRPRIQEIIEGCKRKGV